MLESANTQLIEQLETSVSQVQAENNQLRTEVNQQKTESNQLKTENHQLRHQIAAERIQLESHHKEEKFHLESRHKKKKQILQSEVDRLTKELERITTVSINKKSVVSILHSYKVSTYIILSRALTTLGLISFNDKV